RRVQERHRSFNGRMVAGTVEKRGIKVDACLVDYLQISLFEQDGIKLTRLDDWRCIVRPCGIAADGKAIPEQVIEIEKELSQDSAAVKVLTIDVSQPLQDCELNFVIAHDRADIELKVGVIEITELSRSLDRHRTGAGVRVVEMGTHGQFTLRLEGKIL